MGARFWRASPRWRGVRRFAPWIGLTGVLLAVRLTKGAGFLDFYALVTRPLWPGQAQREWLEGSLYVEHHAKLNLLEQENKRLKLLLSLDKDSKRKGFVSAPVISRSAAGWWQQLDLGKGFLNGIEKDDVVIGPGGLVGRVSSVTPSTARVLLLTSPSSRVAVWISRNQQHGMLIGNGTNRPELIFLNSEPKVLPGDLVSTSPSSSLMPPNLPVGVIQSLDEQALPAPRASVQLLAAPEAIDWVQVQKL